MEDIVNIEEIMRDMFRNTKPRVLTPIMLGPEAYKAWTKAIEEQLKKNSIITDESTKEATK